MKKKYFLLLIVVILFNACSSSDSVSEANNPDPSVVLIKRIDNIYSGNHAFTKFFYEGRKIVKIINELPGSSDLGYKNTDYFYYTGNLITEIKRYDKSNENVIDFEFTYDTQGKLTSILKFELSFNIGTRRDITYNSDGTVLVQGYFGTLESQTDLKEIWMYHYQGNQIVRTDYSGYGESNYAVLEYDTFNSPIQNVTGLDEIAIAYGVSGVSGIHNNVKKATVYETGMDPRIFTYDFIYNTNNYPLKKTRVTNSDTYDYEYF